MVENGLSNGPSKHDSMEFDATSKFINQIASFQGISQTVIGG